MITYRRLCTALRVFYYGALPTFADSTMKMPKARQHSASFHMMLIGVKTSLCVTRQDCLINLGIDRWVENTKVSLRSRGTVLVYYSVCLVRCYVPSTQSCVSVKGNGQRHTELDKTRVRYPNIVIKLSLCINNIH